VYQGHEVIDADCHVIEPAGMWEQYLEPEFRAHALTASLEVDGEPIFHKLTAEIQDLMPVTVVRDALEYQIGRYDPPSQAQALRILGVDVAFLYPSYGAWLFAVDTMEARLAGAFVRAYNNWLHDFCSHDPALLRGVGVVNRHAPEEMVTELQRVAAFGWKAVVIRPNPIKGRILSDPAYEPFWTECERLDMAVGIHEGTYARVPTAGADRFHTHFALHSSSHPLEQMLGLLALLEGGVLERHPRLRVAFLESGGGWVPYWLWRLDRTYQEVPGESREHITMPPSDYFRRQCFVSIEPGEPYLERLLDFIGVDNVIVGTDFPHHDHDPYVIRDVIALEERLPPGAVRKILHDNPRRLYGL
jgi:predicted TIM-barrel fold metal-dependent hydrolase